MLLIAQVCHIDKPNMWMACFSFEECSFSWFSVLTWKFGYQSFWGCWLHIWGQDYKIQNGGFIMRDQSRRLIDGKLGFWGCCFQMWGQHNKIQNSKFNVTEQNRQKTINFCICIVDSFWILKIFEIRLYIRNQQTQNPCVPNNKLI